VDSADFAEWAAFSRMHPMPGDDRLHELIANACAILVSAHKKKGQPGPEPDDFMPWRERRRGRPRPKRMEEDLKVAISTAGAAAKRKKKK
jgi:hypothetical protein